MLPIRPAVYRESINVGAYSPAFRGELGDAMATRIANRSALQGSRGTTATRQIITLELSSINPSMSDMLQLVGITDKLKHVGHLLLDFLES